MNALSTLSSSTAAPRIGILSTHPPTPCGLATFSAALSDGLSAHGADVSVVRVADGSPSSSGRVIGELVNGSAPSAAACAELLNRSDVAVIQHEYGLYGGVDGDEVVDITDGLRVPSIVVAHTILKDPTLHQRSVLVAIAAMADQVVVMSEAARQRLCLPGRPHSLRVLARAQAPRLRGSDRPRTLKWQSPTSLRTRI